MGISIYEGKTTKKQQASSRSTICAPFVVRIVQFNWKEDDDDDDVLIRSQFKTNKVELKFFPPFVFLTRFVWYELLLLLLLLNV